MRIENPSIGNSHKLEDAPSKLEELMPFLKETKEEKEYRSKYKNVMHLMSSSSNKDLALAARMQLRQEKKPEEREFSFAQEQEFYSKRGEIAKQLGYEVTSNTDKFMNLKKNGYNILMKHFMLPSVGGINDGRISEIEIRKGNLSLIWDNGWDIEPKDIEVRKIFSEIVNAFS